MKPAALALLAALLLYAGIVALDSLSLDVTGQNVLVGAQP